MPLPFFILEGSIPNSSFLFSESFLGYRGSEEIEVFSSSLSIMLYVFGLLCRITWFCCCLRIPFCIDVFLKQEPKSPPMSPICSPPASPSTYQRIPLTYGYGKSRSGLEQQHGGRMKVGIRTLRSVILFPFLRSIQVSNGTDSVEILKFNYTPVLENDPIISFYCA